VYHVSYLLLSFFILRETFISVSRVVTFPFLFLPVFNLDQSCKKSCSTNFLPLFDRSSPPFWYPSGRIRYLSETSSTFPALFLFPPVFDSICCCLEVACTRSFLPSSYRPSEFYRFLSSTPGFITLKEVPPSDISFHPGDWLSPPTNRS